MKIEIVSGDPPVTTVLGDDANKAAPIFGWRPGRIKSTQALKAIGATAARLYDRGQRVTRMSFAASRNFSTIKDALEFIRNHIREVPNEGTVYISHISDSQRLVMENAQVESVECVENAGCHVVFSYVISGGEFNEGE